MKRIIIYWFNFSIFQVLSVKWPNISKSLMIVVIGKATIFLMILTVLFEILSIPELFEFLSVSITLSTPLLTLLKQITLFCGGSFPK